MKGLQTKIVIVPRISETLQSMSRLISLRSFMAKAFLFCNYSSLNLRGLNAQLEAQ
jgi:hypothetical protein